MSDLEHVRGELRRLGYLTHGFERFLLQDALRPQKPLATVAKLAAKVAVAGGALAALALACGLALANGVFEGAALDLVPLFLHLLPPSAVGLGAAFLVLSGLLMLVLRVYHVRRIERLSLVGALLTGLAVVGGVWWWLHDAWGGASGLGIVLWVVAASVALYLLVQILDGGLLSLAIKLTDLAPRERVFSHRWLTAALMVASALFLGSAFLEVRSVEPPEPVVLPTAPGERVLVLGIDGILADELEYLLARGDLPALARLQNNGAHWRYPRGRESPAELWTSLATGLPGAGHGVTSLDSYRPLGTRTPLVRSGPLRSYWRLVEPLGLVEYRPVLAGRRRAFTFWELAARGGRPVAAINWWSTFPAEPLPGLVVAHGAYQLLEEGSSQALAADSEELVARVELAARAADPGDDPLLTALPPELRQRIRTQVEAPDRFYLSTFEASLEASPRAAALYLAGPDIAAEPWGGTELAFADLVRRSLRRVDDLVARFGDDFGTVAVVTDPGRRPEGGEGRVLYRRQGSCQGGSVIEPEQVAAALLRDLGLPQSAELPSPPPDCSWPAPPERLASFGSRKKAEGTAASAEYLESLKSLGYL